MKMSTNEKCTELLQAQWRFNILATNGKLATNSTSTNSGKYLGFKSESIKK